ncbi:hypothetical protein [Mariniphaga anaerophila]|uniref:hypothetical protein n=1 Tax=Mariniphaga anaerophila TaxID=1484053 RepID=UPI001114C535|nr:hypothetical protein [Mariniphaga anaerophila]
MEKNIKNTDLIAVFQRCPFGEPTADCPFVPYHQLNNMEKQIRVLNTLDEATLEQLRSFHRSCVVERRNQADANTGKSNES